jgi:hypothetical protein
MQKEQGVTTTISSVEEGCDNFGSSLWTEAHCGPQSGFMGEVKGM